MAGSYNHVVADDGQLLVNEQLQSMLECCSGDVYEAIAEMYGMIWWLADQNTLDRTQSPEGWTAAEWVERARQSYHRGLDASPGVNGRHPVED
ncbi:hypothetical protein [Mycobacterium talmoniae]|uniref:Uncharacterized protein n=1 Tax=Mycobacterium talmoniae TaxID=1858794 RepID=A0A1S1NIR5_9MYCO|nr:hypothetical protein [Mycobacterium talmoniae]OHV03719.1 hypothetical protein BKN37_13685 [Mycobacterium talmoniae]